MPFIPNTEDFDENCQNLAKIMADNPEVMLHSFAEDNKESTACGIYLNHPGLVVTAGVYFAWAYLNEKVELICLNCQCMITQELFEDFIIRYKRHFEEVMGGDPWKLPPMEKDNA